MNTTEALQNFVAAIFGYQETGVWPDNQTLLELADCGRKALIESPNEMAVLRADNARLRKLIAMVNECHLHGWEYCSCCCKGAMERELAALANCSEKLKGS